MFQFVEKVELFRRDSQVVARIGVGAMVQQVLGNIFAAFHQSCMQRRIATLLLTHIDIRAPFYQKLNNFKMLDDHGRPKGGRTVTRPEVRICADVEHERHAFRRFHHHHVMEQPDQPTMAVAEEFIRITDLHNIIYRIG